MSKKIAAILLLVILVAALGAGCKKKRKIVDDDDEGGGGSKRPTTPYVSKGEGTIKGVISFEGATPQAPPLDPSGDAFCNSAMTEKFADFYRIAGGKLADVLVYVEGNSIETYLFPATSKTQVIDQRGCRYHPRTIGLMIDEPLTIRNSDRTNHNIHPSPKNNAGFNQSQPAGSSDIVKSFSTPEERIPVKCDLHPWMSATIRVFNHPCFDVSVDDGTYTLTGVPAGSYTLVFWHEKLGIQRMPVTVAANQTLEQNVTFKAGGGPAPAVHMSEPLVIPHIR